MGLRADADGMLKYKKLIYSNVRRFSNTSRQCAKICSVEPLLWLKDHGGCIEHWSEKLVGEINYDLAKCVEENLFTVSRKMVINKCSDLISKKGN